MAPNIEYPYMPPGRFLKYASPDDPFMVAAARARAEQASDALYPVGAAMVVGGAMVARAGNGFNRGAGKVHVCPRIVLDVPSGTGYELCDLHDPTGHAERMLLQVAREAGIDPAGSDVYLYGHWWACEPCWSALIEAGVRDLYVTDDAHERFAREKVYGETLTPGVKSVYIAGPITNVEDFESQKRFYEALGEAAEQVGCRSCIPHRDSGETQWAHDENKAADVFAWATGAVRDCDVVAADVSVPSLGTGGELVEATREGKHIVLLSKRGSRVSAFVRGNPSVVYHIEYIDEADAARQLRNVLRQL
ncbi:hypothetical protein HY631_01240 [Candidatus Uhrbacteria bacterium]|nr:hypothetical protein [Candidatus Uhrbacteria bacterium]